MKRCVPVLAALFAFACQQPETQRTAPPAAPAAEAPRASQPPALAAADLIVRQDLLESTLKDINKSVIAYHADRSDEPLDVAIATLIVGANRQSRASKQHLGTIKSFAELADVQFRIAARSLGSLTADAEHIANTAKVGSFNQDVANDPGSRAQELEVKWNQSFTAEDASDIVQLLPLLKSTTDRAALDAARAAVQKELEAKPELLKPFASAKPRSADVLASRRQLASLIATAQKTAK